MTVNLQSWQRSDTETSEWSDLAPVPLCVRAAGEAGGAGV